NDPALSTHNVQRATEANGGEFIFNAEVVEIRRDDKKVLGVTLCQEARAWRYPDNIPRYSLEWSFLPTAWIP
ncbi:MAG: FAD-dependent oxidoreductase, partial [Pirellulaceae bacterium]